MDDRRFDAFVKSFALGTHRRALVKGLLGLGGAAATGGLLLERSAEAARRPTPTPKPVKCPGKQLPCAVGCCCPPGLEGCGPDCCTEDNVPAPQIGHSECCDNACCFGTCYGEELCCPTNLTSGDGPPASFVCKGANGPNCCAAEQSCCDGACFDPSAAVCCEGVLQPGSCCPGDENCGQPECNVCDEQGLDCCFVGEVFAGCYDSAAEGTCCIASECEYLNNFDKCIVGACTDLECEERGCPEDQFCCDQECSVLPCETPRQCSSDADCGGDIVCCAGTCCALGQACVTTPENNSSCE